MSLLHLIVSLVVLGLVLYVVELFPIDSTIKKIIHIIVIVAVLLWLLQFLLGGAPFSPLRLN